MNADKDMDELHNLHSDHLGEMIPKFSFEPAFIYVHQRLIRIDRASRRVIVSRVSEDETKNVLSYPLRKPKRREKYFDTPAVFQLVICLMFCLACAPLIDMRLHGMPPGAGGGLVCVDCFLLTLVFVNIGLTFVKPRAPLRRISSYCSWGAILLYVVLSVVVAMT